MNSDLDDLKDDVEVLQHFTSRLSFKKQGREYVALCPFHADKHPSFQLNRRTGRWLWNCPPCHEGGSIVDFIIKFDEVSKPEAIARVRKEMGSSWGDKSKQVDRAFKAVVPEEKKKFTTYPLSAYAVCEQALANNQAAKDWLLQERGITFETAKKLHLGYKQKISSQDPTVKHLLDKGWVVFPYITGDTVRLLKYRSIVEKKFARQPGMETVLFNTNTVSPLEDLYVVAGEFDALSLEQNGFRAVSLPSDQTPITPEMKDQLKNARRILLAGDSDESGSKAMRELDSLWRELGEETFRFHWPEGIKDANALLKESPEGFKKRIEELTLSAAANPMEGMYSLTETMLSNGQTNLSESPDRLRFPWPTVDNMAVLLPGSVMSVFATQTKMGKTCFVLNFTVDNAMQHGDVVINYQCELQPAEISTMVAAYLLDANRNKLTEADYKKAAGMLAAHNVRYYVGRDDTLNTIGPVLDLIEAAICRLGATIVVLDTIHFICCNEPNQTEVEANAMQRIKQMAQKYKVKFVVVGQPRKADQNRKGKVVHITDWKGSEAGGSTADAIFAIHRNNITIKDPANPPMDDYEPRTEIHLLAARSRGNGPTFAVLQFYGQNAAFHENSLESVQDGIFE